MKIYRLVLEELKIRNNDKEKEEQQIEKKQEREEYQRDQLKKGESKCKQCQEGEGQQKWQLKEEEGEQSEQPQEIEGEQSEQSQEIEGEQSEQLQEEEGEQSEQPQEIEGEQSEQPQEIEGEQNEQSQEIEEEQREQFQEREEKQSEQNSNEKENDAKKAFREMLKYRPKNEGINKKSRIQVENIEDIDDKEVPDSVINVIIEKFLNNCFIPGKEDLNSRRDSMIPTYGDLKWNIPDLIKHKTTKQYNQMLHDKYGYKKENGEDEKIPLSFYFDLSGSMKEYDRILALMALKLLKKDIKVLIGYNECIEYQIDSVPKKFNVEDMKYLLIKGYKTNQKDEIKGKTINDRIDNYLKEKDAKKVAIFSDFDPKKEIENLSKYCEIYWFCFEERRRYNNKSLKEFKGHYYNTKNIKDLMIHLKNIKSKYYEHRQRMIREGMEEMERDE